MTRRRAPLLAAVAVASAITWPEARASAQAKAQCLSAFDRAQDEQSGLKLLAARDDFMFCARAGCSPPVRKDCAERLEAVMRDLPTLVVGARSASGADVADVAVFVDGERATPDAGGLVSVDPGPHTVRFERPPYAPQTQSIVARVGEKSRLVLARLPEPATAEGTPASSPPAARDERRPVSPWVWVAGGTGVVALGSFTVFALMGLSKHSDLEDRCAPGCSDDDIGQVRTRFIAADVSLGVAAISLATAAVVYFLDKPRRPSQRFARSF